MNSTANAMRRTARGSDRSGLLARLRSRLDRSNERGSILVEAIAFMGVIGITVAAYTTANASMQHVQRQTNAADIVAQQAQGVLEAAQSLPWSSLGFNAATQSNIDAQYGGEYTVKHSEAATNNDDVAPLKTVTRGGVTMTQHTYVTWADCGTVACTATRAGSAYGTKRVTVFIEYTPRGQDTAIKYGSYSILRTSTPAEALSSSAVPDSERPDGSTY